jgi:hypothetical protein
MMTPESRQRIHQAADARLPDSSSATVADLPTALITLLDQQGQPARTIPLTADGLTIGSRPDSGLALDAATVARNHARIDWNGRQALVTALGTRGDTLLDTRRLGPQQPQVWQPGHALQIGPYTLQLAVAAPAVGAPSAAQSINTAATIPLPIAPGPQAFAPPERIAVALAPGQEYMELVPGRLVIVSATVANHGDSAETVVVTVEGLPAGWLATPTQSLLLEPSGQAVVPLTITVPEEADSLAGEYAVTVRARSTTRSNEIGLANARWLVLPFAASRLELTPQRARSRDQAIYTVHVTNLGNAPASYTLSAEEDEQVLSCSFAHPQIEVAPGQTVNTPLTVHAGRRVYGQPRRYDFLVHLTDEQAAEAVPQTAEGQFVHEELLPIWTIPAALALLLLVLLCGFGAFPGSTTAWSGLPLYGAFVAVPAPTLVSTAAAETATAQGTAQVAVQQTIVVGQQTLAAQQATAIAAPPGTQAALQATIVQGQATLAAVQTVLPPNGTPPFLPLPGDTQPGGTTASPGATPTGVVFPTDSSPTAEQPSVEQPSVEQPTAEQPSGTPEPTSTPIEGAELVFDVQPSDSTNLTGGLAFPSQPKISVRNANGDVLTNFNDDITIAIGETGTNPGGGTLSGNLTVAAVSGVADFSGLKIDKAGAGYTLIASSDAVPSKTSDPFTIAVGPANTITVTGGNDQRAVINARFTTPLQATVLDAGGNPVQGVRVNFIAIPNGGASANISTPEIPTDINGVASNSNASANGTVGSYSVSANVSGLAPAIFNLTNDPIPQPTAAQPTAAQPTAAQPTAEQPTAAQPTAAQPTAEQPTAAQPTAEQPTAVTVIAPPTVSLSFNPTTIEYDRGGNPAGQTTLTIVIGNPNSATALIGVSFDYALPSDLKLINENPVQSNSCGVGFVALPKATEISLISAGLAGGASCTIAVKIRTGGDTPKPPKAGDPYTFEFAASATNSTPTTGQRGSATITVVPKN